MSRVKSFVLRGRAERAVVDEKTITQFWSGDAIFMLGFKGPSSGTSGSRLSYEIEVTNRSALPQNAIVRAALPAGTRIAASNPAVAGYEGRTAVWELEGLPAASRQLIAFDLDVDTTGILSFDVRVDQRGGIYHADRSATRVAPDSGSCPRFGFRMRLGDTGRRRVGAPSLTGRRPRPPKARARRHRSRYVPSAISMGKEFNGRVRISKTGDVPKVALRSFCRRGLFPGKERERADAN